MKNIIPLLILILLSCKKQNEIEPGFNKIDKKFILPTEGIGFSNFQIINLSNRPSFSKASFLINENLIKNIKI